MDRVFTGGTIYVERDSFAQAMWVQDGVIRAVGTDEAVLAAAPSGCEQTALAGATVIPGFNDSHLHLLMLGQNLKIVQLHNCTSMEEMIGRGKAFLEKNPLPAGTLLKGFGWNQDYFTDCSRMPDRHDLDRISTEHPIFFSRACGHAVSVNSKMLELGGITSATPQPAGGRYDLGEDGEPNGVFHECASTVFANFLPAPTVETLADDIRTAMDYASSVGITTVQSNDINEGNCDILLQALHLLRDRGELRTRYYGQCSFSTIESLQAFFDKGHVRGAGDDFVQIGPLKMFVDGSLGARTALLRGAYADDDRAQGIQTLPDDLFDSMVQLADANNNTVVVHAIGDLAIEKVLDSYDKVIAGGPNKNRHGVIHVQITDLPMLERFKTSDILAMVQPIFLHYDMYIVADRVGKALAETSYAFGTLTHMGVHTSYGTDCPVEDLNPFENLYTAVARKDLKCKPESGFFPAEAVDIQTAIDNYTLESAYACFAEDRRGRLKAGYQADFVILDADLFTVPEEQILKVRPVATYMDGKQVYRK